MGVFDNMKDKIGDLVEGHGDKADEGMEQAGDVASEKTGGKYDEQVDQAVQRGQDATDQPPAPPPA